MNTFMTSSPWLMNLMATLLLLGLGNGRETVEFTVSQASWLVSALKALISLS